MDQRKSYSFPIIKNNDELLACMEELNVSLTDEDLKNPNPDVLRSLYENLLESLMALPREEIQQPVLGALDALSYPELYDESIYSLNFIRNMQEFMAAIGVRDWTMDDIYRPNPKRTRIHLSGVINFAKFREERYNGYYKLQETSDQIQQDRVTIANTLQERLAEHNALKAEAARREKEARALTEETDELAAEITTLNKEQAALQASVRKLKTENNELVDKTNNTKFLILNTRQENEKLRSQIVRSPQRVKKQMADMGETLSKDQTTIKELDAERRRMQERLDCIMKAQKDVRKCTVLMADADNELQRYKATHRQVKEVTNLLVRGNDHARNLSDTVEHLKRQIKTAKDKQDRLGRQKVEKEEYFTEADHTARKEQATLEREKTLTAKRVQQNEALTKQLKQKADAAREAHARELRHLEQRYAKTESQVYGYIESLAKSMR